MKLPKDKKQLTQLVILAGIVTIATIYTLWSFLLSPLWNAKNAKLAEIEELKEKIEKAEKEIKHIRQDLEESIVCLKKILQLTDNYMLEPRLGGNYMLAARDKIDKIMNQIKISSFSIIAGNPDIISIPQNPSRRTENTIKGYSFKVNLLCSYEEFMEILSVIQKENPMVHVVAINITARQPKDDKDIPEAYLKQNVSFIVNYPIWANQDIKKNLKSKMEELTSLAGGNNKI